jgi:hypothetical protein
MHLIDPADQRADNSVPLMAKKAIMVRVYVLGILLNTPFVNGELEVQNIGTIVYGSHISPPILPQRTGNVSLISPGKVIDPYMPVPYFIERGDLRYTLNFLLPAEEMIVVLKLRAKIFAGYLSDYETFYLNVTRLQTLRLAGIMIGYNGPDRNGQPIVLNAPTLTDLQATSAFSNSYARSGSSYLSYRWYINMEYALK